jgi:alkanesulfonate monooxygenase SsuD/methylene tetrahydromethanopterin reductase-like flavin-dependent oxidoreductase (luciferase family)
LKIGVLLPGPDDDPRAWLAGAAAFEAAGADALWIEDGPGFDPVAVAAGLAAITYRSSLMVRIDAAVAERTRATLEALSRGRLTIVTGGPPEDWLAVAVPENREAWRATLADASEHGSLGVIVPADPRLIDLLRNPDERIDRSDLQLAQG